VGAASDAQNAVDELGDIPGVDQPKRGCVRQGQRLVAERMVKHLRDGGVAGGFGSVRHAEVEAPDRWAARAPRRQIDGCPGPPSGGVEEQHPLNAGLLGLIENVALLG
jgi:hypothetical protein